MRSLVGLRVLDLSRLLPGPFLTMVLADLGADVIKVEEPRGGDYLRGVPPLHDGMAGRFWAVNRGKRSLALDLKTAPGVEAFLRLVQRADVVVESFRPGVIDRLGIGWAALSAKNPRVILCSLSGYGQTGPYAARAGHDLNYVGLAGGLGTAGPGGVPAMPAIQVADFAGGGLWGATAILAALIERGRTGTGQHLDVAMSEGALALLAAELGSAACGERPTRGDGRLSGGMACYAVYRTQDDKFVTVAALEPKFWLAFNHAIGRVGNVAELAAPGPEQARIRGEVQAALLTRTRAQWVAALASVDGCCEPVLDLDEVPRHPQHVARGVFFEVADAAGNPFPQLRTPLGVPATPSPPPRLGEHSAEILAEHGFSPEEIAALRTG